MTYVKKIHVPVVFFIFPLWISLSIAAPPEPPKGGFQGGGRVFSNPFAASGAGAANPPAPPSGPPQNFFDDEEDDDMAEDFLPIRPPIGNAPSGFDRDMDPGLNRKAAPGGSSTAGASSVRATQTSDGNISMGGTAPGGVIAGRKLKPLQIDEETGEGSKETVTDFNFPDADILDIAKTLGKLADKNFILDKDVKGRISIISNSPITVGDAWKAFLTALDMNGYALIPSGKYIRIARRRDARDKQLKTYTGDYSPDTDALVTRVFPLKYLSAEEVARNFRMFMPGDSRIIPYEQTNTVIVTDTGSNIAKLHKLLEILDVEGYDAGIEVIPVKYASAVEFSKLIDTLIPGSSNAGGGPPGAPRFGGSGRFTARRTKEGGIINTIIADERTNTLIVHANTKGADQVRELVTKLDQKLPTVSGGGKIHVIYLQFADAEQISNTLNNFTQQSGRQSGGGGGGPMSTSGTGVNPIANSLFEGNIKVSPDKATNSLVVTASPSDFVTVQRVVNRLDIPRDQVYVEAVIMELSMGKTSEWSSGLIAPKYGVGLNPTSAAGGPVGLGTFLANPADPKLLQGFILPWKPNSGDITLNGPNNTTIKLPNLAALLRWFQSTQNASVLATPQIMAMDNTEATFESGDKISFPTTMIAAGGASTTSFTRESVSLSLSIKPQINKVSNFVKMEITAKMADLNSTVQIVTPAPGQPPNTTERSTKTSVVVADSDTVVLGGLMRDKQTKNVFKIPLLGDIPLLGWLFRSSEMSSSKTNLMIFLTPKIVRNYDKIRDILAQKIKERQKTLEKTDTADPYKEDIEDIQRSLPDLKELMDRKIERTANLDDEKFTLTPTNEVSKPQSGAPFVQPQPGVPAGVGVPAPAPAAPQAMPITEPPAPQSFQQVPIPAAPVPADKEDLPPPPADNTPPPAAGGGVTF